MNFIKDALDRIPLVSSRDTKFDPSVKVDQVKPRGFSDAAPLGQHGVLEFKNGALGKASPMEGQTAGFFLTTVKEALPLHPLICSGQPLDGSFIHGGNFVGAIRAEVFKTVGPPDFGQSPETEQGNQIPGPA